MIRICLQKNILSATTLRKCTQKRLFGLFFKKNSVESVSSICNIKLEGENSTTIQAFDQALEAILNYQKNPQTILSSVFQTEPNFVLGHAINSYLSLLYGCKECSESENKIQEWLTIHHDESQLNETQNFTKQLICSYIELKHHNFKNSINILESILMIQPTNILVIKFLQEIYNQLGAYNEMRSSIYRIWPYWSSSYYGYKYMFGIRSFAQIQAGDMAQAEETALEGLNINKEDMMSLHSLLHFLEKQGRLREEMRYIRECEEFYIDGSLNEHIQYHKCLNHIHQGNTQFSINNYIDILSNNSEITQKSLMDKTNLLLRYELENQDMTAQWRDLYRQWKTISKHYFSPSMDLYKTINNIYNDEPIDYATITPFINKTALNSQIHISYEYQNSFINPLLSNDASYNMKQLINAIQHYKSKEYSQCANILLSYQPLLSLLGEEFNYYDCFNIMTINSCYYSKQYSLCERLLYERTCQYTHSGGDWENLSQVFKAKGDEEKAKHMHELGWTLGYGQGGHNAN